MTVKRLGRPCGGDCRLALQALIRDPLRPGECVSPEPGPSSCGLPPNSNTRRG